MKVSLNILLFLAIGSTTLAQKLTPKQLAGIIDDNGLPGIQVAYTLNNKTTELNAGLVGNGLNKKVDSKTIFRAGSLGKSVFAYAVMRLYDRALISLDTPLLHYLGNYDRFDSRDPRFAKITARMVLSHSSGLAEFSQFDTHAPVKLLFEPGTLFAYSGEGIWFLQKTVEKITGKSLGQLMREEVFGPLKMNSSTYMQTATMDSVMLGTTSRELAWMYPNAAFSLLTNAHDYNIFLQALLNGKGLKPETRQLMVSTQSNAQWYGRDTTAADKYIDWGLGVGLQQNVKGKAIWHWGSTDDFYSFYVAFPVTKQSLVFFTRGDKALKITDELINSCLGTQTTWAMQWLRLGYDHPETMARLFDGMRKKGTVEAATVFNNLKASGAQFSERDINNYGQTLLKQYKYKRALAVFKQQAAWYPQSPIAYSGIAAAAGGTGNAALAMVNYKQALVLDPGNQGIENHIKALESDTLFSPTQLKQFEGKYKRADNGMFLQVKAVGNKLLITQSWDGGKLEFFRVSGLGFYNDEPGFTLKFERNAKQKVWKAFVNDMPLEWVRVY